jgi:hypothetical protein
LQKPTLTSPLKNLVFFSISDPFRKEILLPKIPADQVGCIEDFIDVFGAERRNDHLEMPVSVLVDLQVKLGME